MAFDTATPAVTVALHDGREVLASSSTVDARRHGELLAPAIAAALAQAGASSSDLTGVAVGVGPGPFTGLRVGLVTAHMLGFALGIPVHGACTLDVMAHESDVAGPLCVTTDARRKEVYWARYDGARHRLAGPAVNRPADVDLRTGAAGGVLPVVGAGAARYPETLGEPHQPAHPSAAALAALVLARLAAGEELLEPEPMYLRRPDAATPGPRKQVSSA